MQRFGTYIKTSAAGGMKADKTVNSNSPEKLTDMSGTYRQFKKMDTTEKYPKALYRIGIVAICAAKDTDKKPHTFSNASTHKGFGGVFLRNISTLRGLGGFLHAFRIA